MATRGDFTCPEAQIHAPSQERPKRLNTLGAILQVDLPVFFSCFAVSPSTETESCSPAWDGRNPRETCVPHTGRALKRSKVLERLVKCSVCNRCYGITDNQGLRRSSNRG